MPGKRAYRPDATAADKVAMFQHQGIWLPDGEQHFPDWMTRNGEMVDGRGTYQIKKLREAMKWVSRFRIAVDVGGHVGLWSMQLARRFGHVHAYEPVASFRDCFRRNVTPTERFTLHKCALGAAAGHVVMALDPADTGGTHVAGPGGDIELRPLDAFEFQVVDFLKIDCEGYELEVLKGARETLERCRPCVIVEQKPHKLLPNFGIHGTPAVDYLRDLGAVVRREMSGDWILSWE